MNKKSKNIIVISIIIVLLISVVLTFHFAKKDGNQNTFREMNIQMQDERYQERNNRASFKRNEVSKDGKEITEKDIAVEKDEDEEDTIVEKDEIKDFQQGHDGKLDISKQPMVNPERGMQTKYVVILCVEMFLLGASAMYLIVNNIEYNNDKEIIVVKEKKDKK